MHGFKSRAPGAGAEKARLQSMKDFSDRRAASKGQRGEAHMTELEEILRKDKWDFSMRSAIGN
eukprot:288995-Pyramimonas_sp.AAC.1